MPGVHVDRPLLAGATGITDFAANPWVNLFIAGVFIVFALSLFGAFELQLPSFILNRLNATRTMERQRLVYDALGPLMKREIHALSISAKSPDEH